MEPDICSLFQGPCVLRGDTRQHFGSFVRAVGAWEFRLLQWPCLLITFGALRWHSRRAFSSGQAL